MQRPTADIPHPVCCVGIQIPAIPTKCSTVSRRPAMLPDSRANASTSPAGGRGRSARSALPKSLFKTQAVGTVIPQQSAAVHEPSSRYESYSKPTADLELCRFSFAVPIGLPLAEAPLCTFTTFAVLIQAYTKWHFRLR